MAASKKVLLINPPATRRVYLETNVRAGTPILPSLGLAAVAASLIRCGHNVQVIDLDLADVSGESSDALLGRTIKIFNPDVVGLTAITPTWDGAMRLSRWIKAANPSLLLVAGGIHAT